MSIFSKSHKTLSQELAAAIRDGKLDKTEALYRRGVRNGPRGETALALAVIHDREKVVDFLLGEGGDPKQHHEGLPLLVYALDSWRSKISLKLLQAGADPNDKGDGRLLPVFKAFEKYRTDALASLVEYGANPDSLNAKGEPLIVVAARGGNLSLVRGLVAKGADIHAVDPATGATALHHAARDGRADMVIFLLEAGADELRGDGDMRTPVTYAEREQHKSIAAILRGERPGAKAERAPDDWQLVAADEVARVTAKNALRYSVTEIFNFSARTYTQVMRNMDTRAESQAVKSFSAVAEGGLVDAAQAALEKLGGSDPLKRARRKLPGPAGTVG